MHGSSNCSRLASAAAVADCSSEGSRGRIV
jgi:hypothetical protein